MKVEFLEAGEIVTTHGVHGEVKILPWSDGPEFLMEYARVMIDDTVYKVESCRVQKTCNIVKLSGVDTIENAMALRGKVLKIFRQDAPADIIFAAELIGVEVYARDENLGQITEVLDYPGNSVYVVKGEHSYMIPAVKAFILSTDLTDNRMQVKLIEGMRTDEN